MWEKPLPNIDPDNRPLFEAYRDHEYKLWRCTECGEWYFWKTYCEGHDTAPDFSHLELAEASGRGSVFAPLTTQRVWHPGFRNEIPYNYSLIELDEDPIVSTQVIGIDPHDVHVGLPVEVTFRDVDAEDIPEDRRAAFPLADGFTLPYFAPVEGGESA